MTFSEQDQPDIEVGRLLFAGECQFIKGVKALDQLPELNLPEVAFAGRSNVGKSSLINALTNRKTLARISNTPGRTREINFFDLGGRLVLVDLPGYGYARVSRSDVKQWTALINDYLRQRPALRRTCVLIDARRGILRSDEVAMAALDEVALSYQIVLTKADKLKPPELQALTASVVQHLRRHPAAHPEIIPTSSVMGTGLEDLRSRLAALAN